MVFITIQMMLCLLRHYRFFAETDEARLERMRKAEKEDIHGNDFSLGGGFETVSFMRIRL